MDIYKSKKEHRQNQLSLTPGGKVVVVEMENGKIIEYDNIKYPNAYIRKVLKNEQVKNAYIK